MKADDAKQNELRDIDKIYSAICNYMSVREKISYCAQLIYRTHTHLSRHGSHLTRMARSHSMEVLQYARQELHHLLRTAHSPNNHKP